MNYWFIAAGTLLLPAFFVHTFSGNRFYACLNPRRTGVAEAAPYEAWMLGRAGFQLIGADLLLAGLFLLAEGFSLVGYDFPLTLFITLLYGVYCVVFLAALACERAAKRLYKRLPQWLLFLAVCLLATAGMLAQ